VLEGLHAINQAFELGEYHEQPVFKTGSPIMPAGMWADLSMGAGIPRYNAYVGVQLQGTPLFGEGNFGIYTGQPTVGKQTYLIRGLYNDVTAGRYPGTIVLADYLYFYPLIDGDDTDIQAFENIAPVPRLPRQGAQLALVCTTPNTSGLVVTATINYLNQNGALRTTTCQVNSNTVVGQVAHHGNGGIAAGQALLYLPLGSNDTGVSRVVDIQLNNPAGGFFALVMVNQEAVMQVWESSTPIEYEWPLQKSKAVEIVNGAYLNMFACVTGGGLIAPRLLLEFIRG
jgi:hypothetical protein